MRRRHVAIAVASAVAGLLQATHSLAYAGRVELDGVAVAIATTAIEMIVLSFAFGHRVAGGDSAAVPRLGAGGSPDARWLVAATAVAVALGVVLAWCASLLSTAPPLPPGVIVQIGAFDGLLSAGLWALVVAVPEIRARAVELERLRVAAELATLRAHVQPHFLMNTLNAISALVTEDPARARELVAALGDLLREALDDRGETHTLAEEIAWLRRYALVIETRHRVRFRWDVAAASERVAIPRMLLQPLVENAVKHGALRRHEDGEVAIQTRVAQQVLTCVIEDNGPGPVARRDGALGLDLVARRLALTGHGTLRLERADGRTRSVVELPLEVVS
jgi:two-component sensor histidine kinase